MTVFQHFISTKTHRPNTILFDNCGGMTTEVSYVELDELKDMGTRKYRPDVSIHGVLQLLFNETEIFRSSIKVGIIVQELVCRSK